MLRATVLTAVAAVLLVAGTANAQPVRHAAVPPAHPAYGTSSERTLDLLLAQYDSAVARRNRLEIRRVEDRVKQVLRSEIMEGQLEARRYGLRVDDVPQARRILQELQRLETRFGRRAVATKRELLVQASRLDLDDRPERVGAGRRGPRGNR